MRAPVDVCVIDDPRATELSGLVAVGNGYVAINDSQLDPAAIHVVYLDATCKVTAIVKYPSAARDPEDLTVAPDGTLWVADIGDNITSPSHRQTIALWRIPPDGSPPVIYRLAYPDGPHDAEALLFADNTTPLIITKETSGRAGLYEPAGPLQAQSSTGLPMKRVGEFSPRSTGENNALGELGEILITGAAIAPDRRRVALRTYTAAYEWDVPDGDLVKAITTGTPRVTALPDEPQGESLAYTPDGTAFLTVSDEPGPTVMRRHVPSTVALPSTPSSTTPAAAPPSGLGAIPMWYSVAAAVAGLVLAAAGFLGLRRARRAAA
jgi:hypothetical protein